MAGWIIYHPVRKNEKFGTTWVYFDNPSHNQDPYVWNEQFLHTYCHMTQIKNPSIGDTLFWVSGNCFPDFNMLACDLVFVVQQKEYWVNANDIPEEIVDSPLARRDHYAWWGDHPFKKKRRFTLKADPTLSFQPQDDQGRLIDLVPILDNFGVSLRELRLGLRANRGSKPFHLPTNIVSKLYNNVYSIADNKLTGYELQEIRARHPELTSQASR